MINGSTQGIRASILAQMETLYEIETDRDEFVSTELLTAMAAFTGILEREVSVYIDRSGQVLDVSVGDSNTVPLTKMNLRRGNARLCGLRCIHTHPGGDETLSAVDLQSLQKLRFDAMAALGVKDGGIASALMPAFLIPDENGVPQPRLEAPKGIYQIPQQEWMARIYDSDALIGKTAIVQDTTERAILVALEDENSESVKELRSLSDTAGVQVLGVVTQKTSSIDPATYIGKGKANELSLTAQALDADMCIFNDELSGAQIRNLENLTGCRIIDRTMLILDIFAQRAQSREGKLQVELAQLKYNSSRLTGLGVALSRLGGGIGTRGPGETKLETDRRHIRSRIGEIEREIKMIDKNRATRRSRRERNEVPVCALVGYTNAGKSTLLNALSGADVFVQDALFATLDPTTRRIDLPNDGPCLLVDTVGFISKLPHALVEAFKSTLEEALYADLLLIVSDASNPSCAMQQQVVDDVLAQLGAKDKPRLNVFNKTDRPQANAYLNNDAVAISAKTGKGLDALLCAIEKALAKGRISAKILVPYARGDVAAFIHKYGIVTSESYEAQGTLFEFSMDSISFGRVSKMLEN